MTKKKALQDLIKIAILTGTIILITIIILIHQGNNIKTSIVFGIIIGCYFSGVTSGWIWANNIITAVSLFGIVLKLQLSLILGLIALPVRIIKNTITLLDKTSDDARAAGE